MKRKVMRRRITRASLRLSLEEWEPKWEEGIRGWTLKFISKNKWRVDGIHDVDDLLNDAYLIFMKIKQKYPQVVDKPCFMGLYKRAITNWMHDHSRYVRRKRAVHDETSVDAADLFVGRIGEVSSDGYLMALLAEAPPEVRAALHILVTNPEVLRSRSHNGRRENLNAKLRRILGMDKSGQDVKYDFASAIRSLLA
jgi:hypothetical protein